MTLERHATFGVAHVVGLLMAGWASAQAVVQPAPTVDAHPAQVRAADLNNSLFRASQILGLNIENSAGENVGEIKDVVINPHSGKIRYIALSVGGFLGIGDKLFAVPFDVIAFVPAERAPGSGDSSVNRAADNPPVSADAKLHDVVAVVDLSKETLKGAQGFDEDNWPNMADSTWATANDHAYDSVRRRTPNSVDDMDQATVVRASQLNGLNVKNAANETVGEIKDLVLDNSSGRVRYSALSVGGFLGIGDKLFAIPLSAFTISADDNGSLTATLPVTKESFNGVEGFDESHWPNLADPSWRDRNDRSYQAWQHRSVR